MLAMHLGSTPFDGIPSHGYEPTSWASSPSGLRPDGARSVQTLDSPAGLAPSGFRQESGDTIVFEEDRLGY